MAAAHSRGSDLSEDQRRLLGSWVERFGRSWDEGRLAAWARELPSPASPLRLPLLVELVKADLQRHWQHGQPVRLEVYLRLYPELGTADTVPGDLIQAEFLARRRAGDPVTAEEFVQRFPHRAG